MRLKGILAGFGAGMFCGVITLNLLMGLEAGLFFGTLAAIWPISYDDPR